MLRTLPPICFPACFRHRPGASAVFLAAAGLLLFAGTARAEGELELRRNAVVRAVEKARSAVVPIHTTRVIRRNIYGFELQPRHGKGVGSGVIFHPDGYVITNAHVIDLASEVLVDVTTEDGVASTREARVFAIDVPNDLAILRLVPLDGETAEAEEYPYLELGSSDDLMLGETVIAIGNPFGIGISVTTGVIGGLRRTLRPDRDSEQVFDDFIQIDAAINPGNSGGPLFDVTGRWIGVNTAIWNRKFTTAEGIGFAIPVDRVRTLVGRAFKRRLLHGDWLGIELEENEVGVARVRYVYPRGPGQVAGLKRGDLVTGLNGRTIPTLYDLRWQMAFLKPGATARLGVHRKGRALPETVNVQLLPVPTGTLSERHLGIVAADVGEKANRIQRFAFDAGVVVSEVRPDGPADRIGIQPGDLLVALGSYKIRHSDDLLLFLQYVRPGDIVAVRAVRPVRLESGRVLADLQKGSMIAE